MLQATLQNLGASEREQQRVGAGRGRRLVARAAQAHRASVDREHLAFALRPVEQADAHAVAGFDTQDLSQMFGAVTVELHLPGGRQLLGFEENDVHDGVLMTEGFDGAESGCRVWV
jgi:hypothetical protein